jgi:hypothetical protein
MPRKIFKLCLAIVVAACMAGFATSRADAVGYWNVPGNFCQCWGYGWGAGYHAPLVLGPPTYAGWLNPHEVRLACPPGPPCGYSCESAGCSMGGCGEGDQSLLQPAALPVTNVQPTPMAASFSSPVLR